MTTDEQSSAGKRWRPVDDTILAMTSGAALALFINTLSSFRIEIYYLISLLCSSLAVGLVGYYGYRKSRKEEAISSRLQKDKVRPSLERRIKVRSEHYSDTVKRTLQIVWWLAVGALILGVVLLVVAQWNLREKSTLSETRLQMMGDRLLGEVEALRVAQQNHSVESALRESKLQGMEEKLIEEIEGLRVRVNRHAVSRVSREGKTASRKTRR